MVKHQVVRPLHALSTSCDAASSYSIGALLYDAPSTYCPATWLGTRKINVIPSPPYSRRKHVNCTYAEPGWRSKRNSTKSLAPELHAHFILTRVSATPLRLCIKESLCHSTHCFRPTGQTENKLQPLRLERSSVTNTSPRFTLQHTVTSTLRSPPHAS